MRGGAVLFWCSATVRARREPVGRQTTLAGAASEAMISAAVTNSMVRWVDTTDAS